MKILAIDGNSIMNRAFYGIKALSTSKGEYTNALTGFMNIYLKELEAVQPDCAAVAFDLKAPTFRHKADAAYKANRKGMPHELALQMPLIKEILADLGVKTLECEGFEADDILGTLSEIFGNGDECVILTGDRDSLQLVSESCTVRLATNRETVVYTPDKFREDYGLEPIQLIELKALMGDSSDNISGVKGIGEKTAAALIKEQGNVEQLYENLESMKLTPSVRKKLESGHEDAVRSKFLATIVKNAPIERDTAAYTFGERKDDELKMLLSRLEMNKLMARLGLTGNDENAPQPVKADDLPPLQTAELTADNLPNGKSAFTFDGEKLCVQSGETVYHTYDEQLILKYFTAEGEKVCFEGKTAHRWAFEHGGELRGLTFSCDLAGYLLNSQASEYTAENLCLAYRVAYRADMGEFADVCSLAALAERLKQELEAADMTALYNDIELPLCETLASMEYYGVDADADGIRAFGDKLNEKLGDITDEIYRLAGQEFNISSPKQLAKVLFEDLGLPCKKKNEKRLLDQRRGARVDREQAPHRAYDPRISHAFQAFLDLRRQLAQADTR